MSEYRERETVVVEQSRGGRLGNVLAIVLLVAIAIAAWWFLLGPGTGNDPATGGTVPAASQEAPATTAEPVDQASAAPS